jgi:leucine-rich repeat/coiled-coil domain-containing protein 1
MDRTELNIYGAGITSLADLVIDEVPLSQFVELRSLNLHFNRLTTITNLASLRFLVSLDLSANEITEISGLDTLDHLESLNLSCNQLTFISGLSSLKQLTRLDVSLNLISSLQGLAQLRGPDYHLSTLLLFGNEISELNDLGYIGNCVYLKELVLDQQGRGNPVCSKPLYRSTVFDYVPSLLSLDGKDRANMPVDPKTLHPPTQTQEGHIQGCLPLVVFLILLCLSIVLLGLN